MLKFLAILHLLAFVTSQGIPDPRCPMTARPVVRLPHEIDCSRFYICQFGLRHLMPACPRGLLFDHRTTACVDSNLVDCSRATTVTTPTISTVTFPTVTTKMTSTTSEMPTVPSVIHTSTIGPTVPEKPAGQIVDEEATEINELEEISGDGEATEVDLPAVVGVDGDDTYEVSDEITEILKILINKF